MSLSLDFPRIQVFDSNFEFSFNFGSFGTGSGQFIFPRGIALDQDGNIYVADSLNDRIQIFDNRGIFLTTFGSFGNGDGQFDVPRDVIVDESGNVYVSDSRNNRIQVFSPIEGSGISQSFPILPEVTDGRFVFRNVPSRRWFDPPLATGYDFNATGDSFFSAILGLPSGVDSDNTFNILANGIPLGNFSVGDSIDFVELIGEPVANFSIRGIDPALEPDDPLAFPIRLAFDTPTADFQMIPFIEDVPNNNGGNNQTVPEPRFILGLLATSLFVWRNKQKNLLRVAA